MTYEEYENLFAEQLKMPGVDVSVLPSLEALNMARMTVKPRVFVIYNGSQFAEREELDVVAQAETLRFEVFIQAIKRSGANGIFGVADEVNRRLLGFCPPDAQFPITFSEFGYVSGVQNGWQYALAFTFTAYKIEACRPEPEQVVTKVNFNTDTK